MPLQTIKNQDKKVNKKTQKQTHTRYFDTCTQLLYKDREIQLLHQLCSRNTHFTQQLLKKEVQYFLQNSHDTKYAKTISDIDELCYYLRVTMKHKGLFERIMGFFSDNTNTVYHLMLQSLNAKHYFTVMVQNLRSDNNNPLFQYIFFQVTKDISTKKQFNGFQNFIKTIYGEEFFLKLCYDELRSIRQIYTEHKNQLMFMLRNKGFDWNDMFTSRNPAYYFNSNMSQEILTIFKNKINQILQNINILEKHIRASPLFATQSKQHRRLMEKHRHELHMRNAREERLNVHKKRNSIESKKVAMKQNRNAIELMKLLK